MILEENKINERVQKEMNKNEGISSHVDFDEDIIVNDELDGKTLQGVLTGYVEVYSFKGHLRFDVRREMFIEDNEPFGEIYTLEMEAQRSVELIETLHDLGYENYFDIIEALANLDSIEVLEDWNIDNELDIEKLLESLNKNL